MLVCLPSWPQVTFFAMFLITFFSNRARGTNNPSKPTREKLYPGWNIVFWDVTASSSGITPKLCWYVGWLNVLILFFNLCLDGLAWARERRRDRTPLLKSRWLPLVSKLFRSVKKERESCGALSSLSNLYPQCFIMHSLWSQSWFEERKRKKHRNASNRFSLCDIKVGHVREPGAPRQVSLYSLLPWKTIACRWNPKFHPVKGEVDEWAVKYKHARAQCRCVGVVDSGRHSLLFFLVTMWTFANRFHMYIYSLDSTTTTISYVQSDWTHSLKKFGCAAVFHPPTNRRLDNVDVKGAI